MSARVRVKKKRPLKAKRKVAHVKVQREPFHWKPWLWSVLILSLIVAAVYVRQTQWPAFRIALRHVVATITHSSTSTQTTSASKPVAQFDFYAELPKNSKPVTKHQAAVKKGSATVVAAQKHYVLQVAAFHSEKDATRLKAELILMGFAAMVKTAQSGEAIWHRVFVGPYDTVAQAKTVRQRLQENHIQALLRQEVA